jgi:hypothetical protein
MKPKHWMFVLFFVSLSSAAQTVTLYDNFEGRFLNQALWYSACSGFSVNEVCATEVQDEHLHLARGQTGNTGSNSGNNGGSAIVFFNAPSAIRSITADIVVRNVEIVPCATNQGSAGQADIIARFFNAGNGTESDDVGASIFIGRSEFSPEGQLYVMGGYFHANDYSHVVFLANITEGTPVTATVTWDQANHRFLYSVTNKITHVSNSQMLAYSFADTTPAADPEKHLNVDIFPNNCATTQTWVRADALFDNVYIGQ